MWHLFWGNSDGKNEFGMTREEALKDHARWCIETLRNNVPDEIAMDHIFNKIKAAAWWGCPDEYRKNFAGDAVFNAYLEIKSQLDKFKEFYTKEEMDWINSWMIKKP